MAGVLSAARCTKNDCSQVNSVLQAKRAVRELVTQAQAFVADKKLSDNIFSLLPWSFSATASGHLWHCCNRYVLPFFVDLFLILVVHEQSHAALGVLAAY